MTNDRATPKQWAHVTYWSDKDDGGSQCLLELRARVEALEGAAHKHIVETSANILALASRVEALEVARRPAPKVYDINEPLKLTPEQEAEIAALLRPNPKPTPNPSQIRSLLVERVQKAIHDVEFPHGDDEARAAILEVARWLHENSLWEAADVLEREVGP